MKLGMLSVLSDMSIMRKGGLVFLLLVSWAFVSQSAFADEPTEEAPQTEEVTAEEVVTEEVAEEAEEELTLDSVNTSIGTVISEVGLLWTCIAAFLVFFMQAGFAMVEAGFTRSKNAVNIIMKNLMDFSIGSISFWLLGFGLMFGATSTGWFGTTDFAVSGLDADGNPDNWTFAFLLFQTVFAATAATIVSGAMAERTKFVSYLVYTVAITVIVYPIAGSWAWGSLFHGDAHSGGWLEGLGFIDFAGSTVVHSVGGWAALAGAIVIGARKGKFNADGSVTPIMGHSMPMAALGVFILWLGWFGFNAGSTTSLAGGDFARIALTTNLSAVGGCVAALITGWVMFGKPDVSLALNGVLAGLVSITAPCFNVSPLSALVIGLIGGVICVFSVVMFDKMKIDDPVGAISVHGVCGAWGTLSAGLFAQEVFGGTNGLFFGGGVAQLKTQVIGVLAYFVWAFGASLLIFLAIKYTIGLRVSEEEELLGLDITEHGMHAYPYLQHVESN